MDSSFTFAKLCNGSSMPAVGLGTWQSPKVEVQTAVRAALDAGYRHIDTAYNYKNEDGIGEVLQEYIKAGNVKREDLFIVTKLPMIHMDPKLVKKSIEMSLKKLQLSYIDLYLIHHPVQLEYDGDDENTFPRTEAGGWKAADKSDLLGTWKGMEEVVDLGLAKSIGVSNFSISQIERICKVAKHKPVTNQVECHIYLPQTEMVEALNKLGITVTAYAPIGSPGRPSQIKNEGEPVALEDPVILKLSKKYGKTPAQSPKEEVKTAVRAALDAGYRHIDTAYNYKNEDAIGEVIQEYIKAGKLKRQELFIVTKLPMIHMDPTLVKRSLEMSLKNLQLSYVDMYLIHFPIPLAYDGNDDDVFPTNEAGLWKPGEKSDLIGTWKVMEELLDLGLTKSIGVSNFSVSQIERICEVAKHKPVTNQVECHIYLQQKELFDALKKRGITITAYSPLGSPGRPTFMKGPEEPVVMEDPIILKLAEKYGKTPAQICIRNLMQKGMIVIPKSVTPERIRSNFQVFNFSLSKQEMDEVTKITTEKRYLDMAAMFKDHPERPWL
ncbi:aldo-keto reductase family 1 member B10-like [Ostrea edulis]|uniref:aldo-keto reductase family 1 member B10-like n=1 Tax=Ostrea edulis TaxID=37623 RepID=UPI0024AFA2A3|nr:aldo-keto reductase family 1 member B10-like [Ostrea edulis]